MGAAFVAVHLCLDINKMGSQASSMPRLFSPLALRLLAAFLLVLDLSQEPASALPALPSPDADSDTITDLSTKEAFWWDSEAATGDDLTLSLLPGQSAASMVRGEVALLAIQAAPAAGVAAFCLTAPAHAVLLLPPATAPPVAVFIARWQPVVGPVHHRNSALAHRRSVVLTV